MRSNHAVTQGMAFALWIHYKAARAKQHDPIIGRIGDIHREPVTVTAQVIIQWIVMQRHSLLSNNRRAGCRLENSITIGLAAAKESRRQSQPQKLKLHKF